MFNQNEGHRRLSMPTSCQNIDLDICSMSLLVLTQVRHTNIKKKIIYFFHINQNKLQCRLSMPTSCQNVNFDIFYLLIKMNRCSMSKSCQNIDLDIFNC